MRHFLLRFSLVAVAAGSLAACNSEPKLFSGVHSGEARPDGSLNAGSSAFSGPPPASAQMQPQPPPN
jgi:hypothetical protein